MICTVATLVEKYDRYNSHRKYYSDRRTIPCILPMEKTYRDMQVTKHIADTIRLCFFGDRS